jgi:hypothetical protein
MSDLYIPRIGLPILLQPKSQTDPGYILIAHRYINVETGKEAVQFHFWEYINRILGTVLSALPDLSFSATGDLLLYIYLADFLPCA